MTAKLVIKRHKPWRTRGKYLLAVIIALALLWALFSYGRQYAGLEYDQLLVERDLRETKLAQLLKSNEELREQIAVLERSAQIDRQAYDDVNSVLTELQDELLELKEELAFYQGIVSPADSPSGLAISRFAVEPAGAENSYRFKLVLSRARQNNRLIEGKVRIAVDGMLNGVLKTLEMAELSDTDTKELNLRFRYFQNMEGDIVLPKDFQPSRLIVEIIPSGKSLTGLKQQYDWHELVG
jgi:hypothetical protein